jgi:hypothetical protein
VVRGAIGRSGEHPWRLRALYAPLTRKTRGRSEPSPCTGKTKDRASLVAAGSDCVDNKVKMENEVWQDKKVKMERRATLSIRARRVLDVLLLARPIEGRGQ